MPSSTLFINRKSLSAFVFLLLLTGVLGFAILRVIERTRPVPVPEQHPLAVEILKLSLRPFTLTRRYTGSVVAEQRGQIAAQVNARVIAIHHREGDWVSKGARLISLDQNELKNEVQRLKASDQRLRAEYRYWVNQHRRNQKLIRQKMISDRQLEESLQMMESRKASIKENNEALANAELRLSYSNITAPFDGRIQRLMTEVGEQAVLFKPLIELVSTQKMKARVTVPQIDLGRLQVGLPVQLRIPATELVQQTVIRKIYPALQEKTRTATFEAYFAENDSANMNRLYPGMVVEAVVILSQHEQALSIPLQALHKSKQGQGVFVLREGKAEWRRVRSGGIEAGQVLILSGLSQGEKIIITPDLRLQNGMPVSPSTSGRNNI